MIENYSHVINDKNKSYAGLENGFIYLLISTVLCFLAILSYSFNFLSEEITGYEFLKYIFTVDKGVSAFSPEALCVFSFILTIIAFMSVLFVMKNRSSSLGTCIIFLVIVVMQFVVFVEWKQTGVYLFEVLMITSLTFLIAWNAKNGK